MNKFNIESAKFVSIVMAMCLIFIVVVVRAYDYLPKNEDKKSYETIQINQTSNSTIKENSSDINPEEDIVASEDEDNKDKLKFIEIDESQLDNSMDIDNKNNSYESSINQANLFVENKEYVSAIKEYQIALKLASNDEESAQCCENLANIYAVIKKYNVALTFAQKAYNTLPNTHRELVLARLYYNNIVINQL